jgi:serine/threonine-protein phosphatase 4 catalytic subunit
LPLARFAARRVAHRCRPDPALCRALAAAVAQFNQANKIDLIARAHQLVMEGYKHMFGDTLVTVWSAPNYCYRCGNVAAILELDEHLNKNYKIFEAAPQEARGVPAKKPAPDYFL